MKIFTIKTYTECNIITTAKAIVKTTAKVTAETTVKLIARKTEIQLRITTLSSTSTSTAITRIGIMSN